jgi:hypothetical protein
LNNEQQNYEELTITNNFIFCKVMQSNPNLCKQLVELIINRKISHMVGLNSEQTIEITPDGKGIRLDVYFEDDGSTMYDIEMQVESNKNLARRSRFYQNIMDSQALEMKDFLDYLSGKLAGSQLTSQLDDAVKLARLNQKWRTEYMLSKIDIDVMKGEYERELAKKDAALAEKDNALAEKDNALAEKDSVLAEKDNSLIEKDARIAELEALLANLTNKDSLN